MGEIRTSTIILLLALVLAIAAFGLANVANAFLWIVVGIFAIILALFAAMWIAIWLLKRRMRRRMEDLRNAIADARGQFEAVRGQQAARSDAIDVEAKVREPDADRPGP